jgi:putative methyltransferase (TIGR04325 family)
MLKLKRMFRQWIRRLVELLWTVVPRGNRYGIYKTFDEAASRIPMTRRVGYDHPEAASLYADSCNSLRPSDYSVLFYLNPLLPEIRKLFDYGGNLGRSYFPFRRVLKLLPEFQWVVCDVPAVAELGRKLAAERGEGQIAFTSEFNELSGCDVLLTSGTLQYVKEPLAVLITGVPSKPRHIFVNRTAIWDRETYVTLEDLGTIVSPYVVRNEKEFVDSILKLGYELLDSWECPESFCHVRHHPARTLSHYRGYYFRLSQVRHDAQERIRRKPPR